MCSGLAACPPDFRLHHRRFFPPAERFPFARLLARACLRHAPFLHCLAVLRFYSFFDAPFFGTVLISRANLRAATSWVMPAKFIPDIFFIGVAGRLFST